MGNIVQNDEQFAHMSQAELRDRLVVDASDSCMLFDLIWNSCQTTAI